METDDTADENIDLQKVTEDLDRALAELAEAVKEEGAIVDSIINKEDK